MINSSNTAFRYCAVTTASDEHVIGRRNLGALNKRKDGMNVLLP